MSELCTDNRFELIEKYKQKLIDATNIETAQDEMAVIDDILFRFWQMGWLDKLDADAVPVVRCKDCNHFKRDISCVGVYGERKTNTCEWHGFADVKPDWYCADGERKDG